MSAVSFLHGRFDGEGLERSSAGGGMKEQHYQRLLAMLAPVWAPFVSNHRLDAAQPALTECHPPGPPTRPCCCCVMTQALRPVTPKPSESSLQSTPCMASTCCIWAPDSPILFPEAAGPKGLCSQALGFGVCPDLSNPARSVPAGGLEPSLSSLSHGSSISVGMR